MPDIPNRDEKGRVQVKCSVCTLDSEYSPFTNDLVAMGWSAYWNDDDEFCYLCDYCNAVVKVNNARHTE